ncbi:ergothioneine biosynthesis protein EgtB [bacterium]|nr:MAG: ergothioneine biosynthesis protein EgtB [bacterium]
MVAQVFAHLFLRPYPWHRPNDPGPLDGSAWLVRPLHASSGGGLSRLKDGLRARLDATRNRTLSLLDRVSDEHLRVRVHEFYSPIGWHFGHVGRTEEYWTCGQALGKPLVDDHLSWLFADVADNPKDNRTRIPERDGILRYLDETRCRVLDALEEADLEDDNPYLAEGYAFDFAIQHECQHQETICEMLQLIQQRDSQSPSFEPLPWIRGVESSMVAVSGGTFEMGCRDRNVYDNEKVAHPVDVEAFSVGRTPVTAFDWTEFIADGGYHQPALWSACGWKWRAESAAEMPEYWIYRDGAWGTIGPFGSRALHPDEPAQSISWFEAEAYARWKGARLLTEPEWEWLRRRASESGAIHGIDGWGGKPVGQGEPSEDGLHDLAGNCWEWTSSAFLPYEGFEAFPYDGYSKDHMKGAHRVCRGGSWATSPTILRPTFRNWYVPTYRQGFLGTRLAGVS